MSETARLLFTAGLLSMAALASFAWVVARLDPTQADKLIGQLRLAQWASVILAGTGAIPIGLAFSHAEIPLGQVDVALGVVFVGIAGIVLQRDPREALLLLAGSFIAHALLDLAHRPGWLSAELAPRWLVAISATYDVCIAALCYWARRR